MNSGTQVYTRYISRKNIEDQIAALLYALGYVSNNDDIIQMNIESIIDFNINGSKFPEVCPIHITVRHNKEVKAKIFK